MATLFFLFWRAQAGFRVESPDDYKLSDINVELALFGNPTFYGNYGKIKEFHECKIDELLEYETIVLLTNTSNCCILSIANEVKNKGGRGVIVVQDSPKIIEKDCKGDDPNIMVIGISKDNYKKYIKNYKTVWVTYQYFIYQSIYPFIEIKLTGNITEDLKIVKSLLKLHSKFSITWQSLRFYIMCNSDSPNSKTDCITHSKNTSVCLDSQQNITGLSKIVFYKNIFNFYQKLVGLNSTSIFLNLLKSAFTDCHYDIDCLSNMTDKYSLPNNVDPNILDRYFVYEQGLSRIVLNTVNIYWSEYLESAFCLSFAGHPKGCEFCSPGCSFSILSSGNCSVYCDNLNCGFSNLVCQQTKGCYKFMLGDGNCNEMCIDDPDCNQDKEYLKFFLYSVIACCFVIFAL